MAAYGGIAGKVTVDGVCAYDIKSWSADITWANEDTTSFTGCDGANLWGQNALTMKSISGTIEANFNAGDPAQKDLVNTVMTGDGKVTLALYPYDAATYLTVAALLTSVNINSTANGIVSASFGFVQSGASAPTFTLPA